MKRKKQYFEVWCEYEHEISLDEILELEPTAHFLLDRKERMTGARKCLDSNDYIEKIFVVDTGSKEGIELHCITHTGVIFILNEDKYKMSTPCMVTIKIARVPQLKRYNYAVSEYTLNKCLEHRKKGYHLS